MAWRTADGTALTPQLRTADGLLTLGSWLRTADGLLEMDPAAVTTPPSPTPAQTATVTVTTTGATFAPMVVLAAGSTATLSWRFNGDVVGVGATPTIDFGDAATRTLQLWTDIPADVRMLNFGFDSLHDSGRYNLGASYNLAPVPVTAVTELSSLPQLTAFMAAQTPLTGPVDFTGLSHLQYIECFQSTLTGVTLTDCSSLIRLCLEQTWIDTLDLNPVRTTLRDLRAAYLSNGDGHLTFTTLTGPLSVLYHYCIRDNVVTNTIPHAQMPVVEERWDWDTHITTIDAPVSPLLRNYNSYGNAYPQSVVDLILTSLDGLGATGGIVYLNTEWGPGVPAAPGTAGAAAKAALIGKGWTVATN